jgi:diguanylate cyclase (GGDEF)-like protein
MSFANTYLLFRFAHYFRQFYSHCSPRCPSLLMILIVPGILQILNTVGIVGLLFIYTQQAEIERNANQWRYQLIEQTAEQLQTELSVPLFVNRLNQSALQSNDLKADNFHQLQQHFRHQLQQFPNLTIVGFSTNQGDKIAVERSADHQVRDIDSRYSLGAQQPVGRGADHELLPSSPSREDWRYLWSRIRYSNEQPSWTPILIQLNQLHKLKIVAMQPVQDDAGQSVGILFAALELSDLHQALPLYRSGRNSKIFVVERSGAPVTTSIPNQLNWLNVGSEQLQPLLTSAGPDNVIRETTEIFRRYGEFQQIAIPQQFDFSFKGERDCDYTQITPYAGNNGLDWQIITTMPASTLARQASHTGALLTLLCLTSLGVTITTAIYLSRKLVRPILRLSEASHQLAQGQGYQRLNMGRVNELAILVESFNQMAQEIQQSRQTLEHYSQELEQKVYERTQTLEQEICKRIAMEEALSRTNQELERLAFVDGLTQVANRRYFDDRLNREWGRLRREQTPLSLILCDIDYFKQYNDTYGHQAGDECLRQVATILKTKAKRPADLVARYGGEEFVLILPDTPAIGAIQVAREIQAHMRQIQIPHQGAAIHPFVTLSLGIASMIPQYDMTSDQLIDQADQALYKAKSRGRNCIVINQLMLKPNNFSSA